MRKIILSFYATILAVTLMSCSLSGKDGSPIIYTARYLQIQMQIENADTASYTWYAIPSSRTAPQKRIAKELTSGSISPDDEKLVVHTYDVSGKNITSDVLKNADYLEAEYYCHVELKNSMYSEQYVSIPVNLKQTLSKSVTYSGQIQTKSTASRAASTSVPRDFAPDITQAESDFTVPTVYIDTKNNAPIIPKTTGTSSTPKYISATLDTDKQAESKDIYIKLWQNSNNNPGKYSYVINDNGTPKLLYDMYNDPTLLRTMCLYNLVNNVFTELDTHIDCSIVNLVLNGRYQGLYLMSDYIPKIPADTITIKQGRNTESAYNFNTTSGKDYSVITPSSIGAKEAQDIKTFIQEAEKAYKQAKETQDYSQIDRYFDSKALKQYEILMALTGIQEETTYLNLSNDSNQLKPIIGPEVITSPDLFSAAQKNESSRKIATKLLEEDPNLREKIQKSITDLIKIASDIEPYIAANSKRRPNSGNNQTSAEYLQPAWNQLQVQDLIDTITNNVHYVFD